MQYLSAVTLLVRDYDEAIRWFSGNLGFELIDDVAMGPEKRWVTMAPDREAQTRFVIARATGAEQIGLVGRQMGGRVGFFLTTDDFDRTYQAMMSKGVKFLEQPRAEPYGKVVVFEDFLGNGWDLIQPA